jgi:AcrR family transcriptional regulator
MSKTLLADENRNNNDHYYSSQGMMAGMDTATRSRRAPRPASRRGNRPAAPRTRSEKKEQTRRQLLEAALALVAEKGFANASVTEIAERAGVTTGAIYSNFRSKEELLLQLVDLRMHDAIPDPAAPPAAAEPAAARVEHLVDSALAAARFVDTAESRQLLLVQIELFLRALRDPRLRREIQAQEREVARQLGAVLAGIESAPPPPGPPPTPEQLAEVFYACLQGLQQHRLMAPALVPDELFAWFVRALLFAARTSA